MSISNVRSVVESTSLVTQRTPTITNLYAFNRAMRIFLRRSTSSDTLPVYIRSDYQSSTPMRPGKTMLTLTLQTVLTLALSTSSGNSSSYSLPIQLVTVTMVIAFSVYSVAILLRDAYPRAASTLDKVASVFAVMGFFLMTNTIILSSHFKWIGWLAFALCMLASIISLVK